MRNLRNECRRDRAVIRTLPPTERGRSVDRANPASEEEAEANTNNLMASSWGGHSCRADERCRGGFWRRGPLQSALTITPCRVFLDSLGCETHKTGDLASVLHSQSKSTHMSEPTLNTLCDFWPSISLSVRPRPRPCLRRPPTCLTSRSLLSR